MEPKFQSSFIPKGPLATSGTATKLSRGGDRSLLATLAVIVFVISVLLTLAGFGYEFYLKKEIAKLKTGLQDVQKVLDSESIAEIRALDQRIKSTGTIIAGHTIATPLFNFLEESTLKPVRYSEFKYELAPDGVNVSVRGEARGYSVLALQSKILSDSSKVKDLSFGDLSLNDAGDVTFTMKAKLDLLVTSFEEVFGLKDNAPEEPPQQ